MSAPFSALSNLTRLARRQVERDEDSTERWYVRRYGRPPYSGDFEDRSMASWHLEALRELWRKRQDILVQVQTMVGRTNLGEQAKAFMKQSREQLEAISSLFGLTPETDDEVLHWAKQEKEGKPTDAQAHVQGLKASPQMQAHLQRLIRPRRG